MEITRTEILEYALAGYERQREQIVAQIQEVERALGRNGIEAPAPATRRRHLSAAARRRISEAQRRRWAKARRSAAHR